MGKYIKIVSWVLFGLNFTGVMIIIWCKVFLQDWQIDPNYLGGAVGTTFTSGVIAGLSLIDDV